MKLRTLVYIGAIGGTVPPLIGIVFGLYAQFFSDAAAAHGNVTPQVVDTQGLPALRGPLLENPYRDNKAFEKAIQVGSSAYSENCARCHGLGAVSGGIAPDLRKLPSGKEGDEYFQMRLRNGSIRNGVTYMPPFKDILSEEATWAIRSWLESVAVEE
jgi:cytochrome c-550 PedF